MLGVFIAATVVVVGGFAVAAAARASRGAPPPRTPPAGPAPSSLPPPAQGYGSSLGISPVKTDPGSSTDHTLSAADAVVSPLVFAIAAGFAGVDEMLDLNPHLRAIDDSGWPPDRDFAYLVKGTADVYRFHATELLDDAYETPVYKSGDGTWVFPTFSEATARPDINSSGVPTFEGSFPVQTTGPASGRVFAAPMPVPPFVRYRAVTPWAAGVVVKIKG